MGPDHEAPDTASATGAHGISRRSLLKAGGIGALGVAAFAGGGAAGWELDRPTTPSAANPATTPATTTTGRFKSEPTIVPPRLQITDRGAPADEGHLLITPSLLPTVRAMTPAQAVAAGKGQMGLMIADVRGQLIWFEEMPTLATNLQVQQYRGEPVLTYWTGRIEGGIGYGAGHLLDSAYQPVATVKAGNGLQTDLHELTLTPQGTALITAYRATSTDLSAVGGPKSGPVQDSVVQEIDLATGKLLFEWSSLDHVPVTESYLPWAKGSYDYFHVNSVALWDDDSLLVSARNTWALYRIDRKSGAVIWRMHGKRSDFTMGTGTQYEWQHHARRLADGQLTVFDDGASPAEEPHSRGLVLAVDEANKTVGLVRAYIHPAGLLAEFEGSVQLLDDGRAVLGFGGEPYLSEFDAKGGLLLDARFPTEVQSYRAFRYRWSATPKAPPKVFVEQDGTGGYAVYVSWNGATEVESWRVLTGHAPTSMVAVAEVPRAGFETAITVHPRGNRLAVEGLDRSGRRLGISATVAL